jgi:hypothetical protein
MGISLIDALTASLGKIGTNGGLRTSPVPLTDATLLGSYSTSQVSGTIAAGTITSLGKIAAFRWAPTITTYLARIRRIKVSMGDLAGFTAGFASFHAFFGRAYTVADSTGATASTMTGNNAKLKTAWATSNGAILYVSTTGLISGGTVTMDTNPIATIAASVVATAGQPVIPAYDLFRAEAGDHGIVLANQEGIVLQAIAPATGSMSFGITVEWDEYSA